MNEQEQRKEDQKQIAETIVRQLGGRRFMMMTGVKQFIYSEKGVSFKIGRNGSKSNYVTVEYDYGRDLYNLVFLKNKRTKNKELSIPSFPIWDYEFVELERTNGIFFDQLQELFTEYTGLYLSL